MPKDSVAVHGVNCRIYDMLIFRVIKTYIVYWFPRSDSTCRMQWIGKCALYDDLKPENDKPETTALACGILVLLGRIGSVMND